MFLKYISILLLLALFSLKGWSQSSASSEITKEQYIHIFAPYAIKEMLLNGIPASITLAQGILESSIGSSPLAICANNHFGIKCHKEWEGPVYGYDYDEQNECFRKYASAEDSYADHSQFLKTRSRYAFLFDLKISDYKAWAKGLKEAGYATNPSYANQLIKIIEEYKLYDYDKWKYLFDTLDLAENQPR